MIVASDYDRSCSTLADCVSVLVGNYCTSLCECPYDYLLINKRSLSQFNADVAMTTFGSGAIGQGG